jgi:hypothetical protein
MTTDENKALFLRYQDAALHHPEALDDLLAADFIAYDLPEGQRDRAALRRFRERVNQLVPDQSVTVDYLLAEGDLVAAHVTVTQTLPDGERVVACLMEIQEMKEGRIAWRRGGLTTRCTRYANASDPNKDKEDSDAPPGRGVGEGLTACAEHGG